MTPEVVTPEDGPVAVPLSRCLSPQERGARTLCLALSGILWIAAIPLTFVMFGLPIVLILFRLLSEAYLVRKLKANAVRVRPAQFPAIHGAYEDCRKALGIAADVDIYIVQTGEMNAFSLGLLRKRVVLLYSTAIEHAIRDLAQLRFLLGHELTHSALDSTFAGRFLLYRNARFRAGREATCDRAGAACAGNADAAALMLKRLLVGNSLYQEVAEAPLAQDADDAKSGFLGWLLRQYATYPPAGDRLRGIRAFLAELRSGR